MLPTFFCVAMIDSRFSFPSPCPRGQNSIFTYCSIAHLASDSLRLVGAAAFAAASMFVGSVLNVTIWNPGPHGLSEIIYAFTSAANNNGSAFAGITAATQWMDTTLGIAMLVGRFFLIIPILAIAGSMARKQPAPVNAGTFPTHTPLFGGLVIGVTIIVAGLTFFPALALGPIVEHLS